MQARGHRFEPDILHHQIFRNQEVISMRDKLYYEIRIALLESRAKDNGKIVAKLKREQRKLLAAEAQNSEAK